jgi:predicted rRNA methylase YqxC with S4 and FtsJ domains
VTGIVPSPITGPEGNVEFLVAGVRETGAQESGVRE